MWPASAAAQTAYAAINRFRLDDLSPHVFRTRDFGATWTEIVAGLRAALAAKANANAKAPVGIFSCSKATNEVNFAAQKFSRTVLGSNNIDSCNRT